MCKILYWDQFCLILESEEKLYTFADNTVITYTAQNWNDLKQKAETDFQISIRWVEGNLLKINFRITKYIPFSCRISNLGPHNIDFHNKKNEVDCIKYLGIIINKHTSEMD